MQAIIVNISGPLDRALAMSNIKEMPIVYSNTESKVTLRLSLMLTAVK